MSGEMSICPSIPIAVIWPANGSHPVLIHVNSRHGRGSASLLNMSFTRQSSHIRNRSRAPGAWNMEWLASRCCMRITTAVVPNTLPQLTQWNG